MYSHGASWGLHYDKIRQYQPRSASIILAVREVPCYAHVSRGGEIERRQSLVDGKNPRSDFIVTANSTARQQLIFF